MLLDIGNFPNSGISDKYLGQHLNAMTIPKYAKSVGILTSGSKIGRYFISETRSGKNSLVF